jgi:hypothetical protein
MPGKSTLERARRDRRQGRAAATQAGEFVHEEFDHVRHGRHGARSTRQAIAIGLSKARRAGVEVKPPRRGQTSERTRQKAELDLERGHGDRTTGPRHRAGSSARRSQATTAALRREGRGAASHAAIARQARGAAKRRRGATAGRVAAGRTTSVRRASGRRSGASRGRRTAAGR